MRPNFFIVGAPKCGTTALSEYLREHPLIFVSTPKEPGFFATDLPGVQYTSDLGDYERLFSSAEDQHLAVGEGSPAYMISREAAGNIHDYAPDARIIVMLRDPMKMLVSYHSQLVYSLFEDRPLDEAWDLRDRRSKGEAIPPGCREPGLLQYAEVVDFLSQVQRFKKRFPPEQLLILFFEDLVADPAGVYERVLAFLEVPSDGRRDFPVVNARKAARSAILNRWLHAPPKWLLGIMQRISGTWLHDVAVRVHGALKHANSQEKSAKLQTSLGLNPGLRKELSVQLRPMLGELGELTGRDLSTWGRPD